MAGCASAGAPAKMKDAAAPARTAAILPLKRVTISSLLLFQASKCTTNERPGGSHQQADGRRLNRDMSCEGGQTAAGRRRTQAAGDAAAGAEGHGNEEAIA